MSEAEAQIDRDRTNPVLSVVIWWSREHGVYIAQAPTIEGVIGTGASIAQAAQSLELNLRAWALEKGFTDEP